MDIQLNISQQIFSIFFAIAWGTSSNVWGRWKPFNWPAAVFASPPRWRAGLSLVVLNVLPMAFYIWIVWLLRGKVQTDPFATLGSSYIAVLPSVIPAIAVFGFWRIWLAFVQMYPECFYFTDDAARKTVLAEREVNTDQEPTVHSLEIAKWAAMPNLLIALAYLGIGAVFACFGPAIK